LITNQVVLQLQEQPALLLAVEGDDKAQQGRLGQIDAMVAWIKAIPQLPGNRAIGNVQCQLGDAQPGVSMHDLGRGAQCLPVEGGTQHIMPIDDLLQSCQVPVQQGPIVERQNSGTKIRIALARQQVMEQDAVLQRRQGIDVLDVGQAARRGCDDLIDVLLRQADQRQHLGCELGAGG
jgi:hypothetical protein